MPSCAVNKIRNIFPADFGSSYIGLKPQNLNEETKVHVNADLSYLCLTALAVVPVLYEIFMYCFPSSPKHFHR